MIQHVLSEWLLAAFSGGRGRELAVYNIETRSIESADPATFLAETDAHSPEIEAGINDIEGPASAAARQLNKLVKNLPPGLYAMTLGLVLARPTGAGTIRVEDAPVVEGMRLITTEVELPMPPEPARRALLRYAGLMYQRAPVTEAAMILMGKTFNRAAQATLDQMWPGMSAGLPMEDELAHRRLRMLEVAADLGSALESAHWFVLRAPVGHEFVLGDCPVMTALSLGADTGWRAILAEESYIIVMPISPRAALLFAPRRLMPVNLGDPLPESAADAVNRLTWRHAFRRVVAATRAQLEASVPADLDTLGSAHASIDVADVATKTVGETVHLVVAVRQRHMDPAWRRWQGCRLAIGLRPYPAVDRSALLPPCPGWSSQPVELPTGAAPRVARMRATA